MHLAHQERTLAVHGRRADQSRHPHGDGHGLRLGLPVGRAAYRGNELILVPPGTSAVIAGG